MSQAAATRQAVRGIAKELSSALLPAWLDQLGSAAEDLDALAADERRLARLSEQDLALLDGEALGFAESGWCVGVLSAGVGSNLLWTRREATGLRIFADQLGRKLGRGLSPGADRIPLLAPRIGAGWEIPLLAGWLLLRSAGEAVAGVRASPDPRLAWRVDWEAERPTWLVPRPPPTSEILPVLDLIPGASLESVGEGAGAWGGIRFPRGSLIPAAAPPLPQVR